MKILEIYDIDETLFHTNAKIYVVKNNVRILALDNTQFNAHELQRNEHYDFSEFAEAAKFYAESKPITRMIDRVQESLRAGNDIYFVTARTNFDNKDLFLQTFRDHGIDIDRIRVERAGNITDIDTGPVRKRLIIRNILKTGAYCVVNFYDDFWPNLREFYALRREFPATVFNGILV